MSSSNSELNAENFGTKIRETNLNLSLEENGSLLIFSGSLKTKENRESLDDENIFIYQKLENNNIPIGTTVTNDNGGYLFTQKSPDKKGLFCFFTDFSGRGGYSGSRSDKVYYYNLQTLYVFIPPFLTFFGFLGIFMYLFGGGEIIAHYFPYLLFCSLIGAVLVSLFQALGFFVGSFLVGYLMSKNVERWIKRFKIGFLAGLFIFAIYGFASLPTIFVNPGNIIPYTVTQNGFLKVIFGQSIFLETTFSLVCGLTTILGGFLRRL